MNREEINLDNPIFVIYLNIDNKSRQRTEELIDNYRKMLNYKNCNFWIIPVQDQETKVEMIWKGQQYDNQSLDNVQAIKDVNKRISKLIEFVSEGMTDDVIKQKLRDFSLEQLLHD